MKNNLKIILGDAADKGELRKMKKEVFLNFAESIRLFLKLPWISEKEMIARTDYEGHEELIERLRNKQGAIIVTGHIGPWELGGAFLAAMGIEVNTVALDHASKRVTEFFNLRRIRSNLKVYPTQGSFKRLRRALEKGECVVLLIDRAYRSGDKRCFFFGNPVHLPNSHVLLAACSGAPVFPAAFLFDKNAGFKLIFRGPYSIAPAKDRASQMSMLQEQCIRDLEDLIRNYPSQFFNFFDLAES